MSSALRRALAGVTAWIVGAAAWIVGAAASVTVSMLALSVIGGVGVDVQPPAAVPVLDTGISNATSSEPASPSPVAPAVPSPAVPSGTRSASAPPPAPPTGPAAPTPGPPRQFDTPAGVVVAQCIGQLAYLVSWSPAPGYRADDVRRGPATTARVTFEMFGSRHGSVVAVECSTGGPRLARDF